MPSLLEARKGKGGGSYGGGSYGGGGYGGDTWYEGSDWSYLPYWAKVLIIVSSWILFVFICAFFYYLRKEFKRKKTGLPFRFGKVLWHSFRAASGLWLPIWLIKQCTGSKEKAVYAKIETQGQPVSQTWGGPPGSVPQGSYVLVSADGKYEPMGYAPYSAQTYAAPANGPPPYANSMQPMHAPTPIQPVQQPQLQTGYYMPAPPAQTAYRSVSPASVSTATTTTQSSYMLQPHNPQTSATYMPQFKPSN